MIPAGYPRDLPSALIRAARDFGAAGVVEIGPDGRETRLDFPTLLELAARILAGLRANGVRAGDPAVVHCTEPVGFFAAFWACTLGGIRPLLISPSPEGDRSEAGRERLRRVTELLGWTVLIGRPTDLPDDLGLPVLDPDALAGHEPTTEFHRPAADDVAVLMLSSGTTAGSPKVIQLTHRGLVEFAAGTPAMLPVRPGQVTLNWLPLDQSGSFLLYHLLPVFTGCTNIHVNTGWLLANPMRWLDLMDQHRVNHSWSPNFGYRLVTSAIAEDSDRHWDLSALRSLVSGGEQITVPVMSEFLRLTNRFGVVPETFVAAWGMTETVTGITFARPGLTPNVHRVRIPPTGVVEWVDQLTPPGKVAVARPGKPRTEAPGVLSLVSVGAPAPGTTVRIVGPNGAVLPEGRIGQLQVASARVTPGYLGNPDADRAAFPVGNWPARKWLATGDQAFIIGGQIVITGRDSERIILNGQNYYAHDIESITAALPGVLDGLVAACGVADATTGSDRLVIFYAPTGESATSVDEVIRAVIHDRLAVLAQVVAVAPNHFPRTPGGKIVRPLLKQRWLEGSLDHAPAPHTPTTPVTHPAAIAGTHPTAPGIPPTATHSTGTPTATPGTHSSATPAVPPTATSGVPTAPAPHQPVRHAPPTPAPNDVDALSAPAADHPDNAAAPGPDVQHDATTTDADTQYDAAAADPDARYDEAASGTELDEDASERTTELPVVRLAWRRELKESIPRPPQRPTFGANRTPEPPKPVPSPNPDPQTDTPEDQFFNSTAFAPTPEPNQTPDPDAPAEPEATAPEADTAPEASTAPEAGTTPETSNAPGATAPDATNEPDAPADPAEVVAPEASTAPEATTPDATAESDAPAEPEPTIAPEASTAPAASAPDVINEPAAPAGPEAISASEAIAPDATAELGAAVEPEPPVAREASTVPTASAPDGTTEPDVPAEPEAKAPEATAPDAITEPDAPAEPEAGTASEASAPDATTEPDAPAEPQAITAPEATAATEVSAESGTSAEPEVIAEAEPEAQPAVEAKGGEASAEAEEPAAETESDPEPPALVDADAEQSAQDQTTADDQAAPKVAGPAEGQTAPEDQVTPEVAGPAEGQAALEDQATPEVAGPAEGQAALEDQATPEDAKPAEDRAVREDGGAAEDGAAAEVVEPADDHAAPEATSRGGDQAAVEVAGLAEQQSSGVEVLAAEGEAGPEAAVLADVPAPEDLADAQAAEGVEQAAEVVVSAEVGGEGESTAVEVVEPAGESSTADAVAGGSESEDETAEEQPGAEVPEQAAAESAPEVDAEPEPKVQSEAEQKPEPELADAVEDAEAEPDAGAVAEPVAGTESASDPEQQPAAEPASDPEQQPAADQELAADQEPASEVESQVEPAAELDPQPAADTERKHGDAGQLEPAAVVEPDDEPACESDEEPAAEQDEQAAAEQGELVGAEAVLAGEQEVVEQLESAPAELTPVDVTPVEAAPVDAAPVDVAPIDAAPVGVTPVARAKGEGARGRGLVKAQVVEPVAVIGLAARLPGAETLEQFWDNLVGGVESLRRFTPDELQQAGGADAFGSDEVVAVSGALNDVESFDAAFFGLSAREAELTDPAQRLFLEVCQQALEHGGHAAATGRIGVFAGSGMNLYTQQNQSGENLATRVAYRLGLTGPAIGVQAAWSSSLVAVHLACQALRSGDADLALAGAAAVHVPQATAYHTEETPTKESILSPTGHVRAFDAEADGTVGGNGVAAVLLKRLDQAIADGDTVYAVIRGSAVSNQHGHVDLVERALEKSGIAAESISYVEANATGTKDADAAEFKALTTALRKHTDKVGFCTIGSVKPNIGHLDSAAGMAGLIKTVLMLQHRTLVPTINYRTPNPALPLAGSPFVIGTEVRDWEAGTPLRAGVSALDAQGTSAHVILEEAPRQVRRGDDGPVVLPLSAPDPHALSDLAALFRAGLELGTGHRLIDLAGTAALGRAAHRHRIAVTGSAESELADALATASAAEVPRGGPGPLGYAFTGQGAARRGMAAGLAARFPVFRTVLDECDRVYAEEFGGSLLELLLTPAGSAEGVWPTETAQPALFAFELALARLWQSFGVRPALVVGHSVGEYAALVVAGALSFADGVRLTAKRGELMQRGTVPGAMVAVRADADRVRELAQTPGVEVAAGNGPQSFVLAGSEVIVGQLAEQLDRLELVWQRLDVDRAFHSSLVDPILADFAAVVADLDLKPLRMPMVSSWSGELLESGTILSGDYLVGQLRQPVLFGDAVEALTAAGCRRFLELGPDAVLSPAGRRIAPNSTWIPTQRLGQDPVLATMNGLAELYLQGTEIAWSRVYPDSGRVPLPTYPFRRTHHPVDPAARPTPRTQPLTVDTGAPVERPTGSLKRIPLDPPASAPAQQPPLPQAPDTSPFAIPTENHDVVTTPTPEIADDELVAAELVGTEVADAEFGAVDENEPAAEEVESAAVVEDEPAVEVESAAEFEPDDEAADAAVAEADPTDAETPEASAVVDPLLPGELYRRVLEVVLDLTGEQLGLDPYDVTVDHTFAELGADSLSMLRVVEEVTHRFAVSVAVSELFEELNTPHKLASAVAARTNPDAVVDPFDLLAAPEIGEAAASEVSTSEVETEQAGADEPVKDSRATLAVLGSGLAELAAKVDAAAAATSEAELPGSGMAALMSQQLRVASQLVDGVTKLMHEQLALLNESAKNSKAERPAEDETPQPPHQAEVIPAQGGWAHAPQTPAPGERAAEVPKEPKSDLAYWQAALSGAQPLVLPADRMRPAASGRTAAVVHELDAALGEAVFGFSRDRRVSPLMTMIAAVGTVLGRFAAQDDVTIGATALRSRGARPMPLRLDLSGEPDLGELAQRVREITTAAFDHAAVDLAVLEQDPLFQVLVEFEEPDDAELGQDLDLRLVLAHHPKGITCTATYRAGLFEETTIRRLLDYLEAVLRRAIADPTMSLPELTAPTESDLAVLRDLEGEPPVAGPIGRLRRNAVVAGELSGLHTLFEQQVARTPDAIALIHGDREITYAELDRRSNAVAWQLVDLGVKPGQLVAVRVSRGAELVVAVLAVLKSAAAYLPLDPGVPESRWAFMTTDAGAVALVGDDAALADRLGLNLVPVAAVDGDARARQAPPVRASADDLAYCIYTSGSSGNPKGVAVPHRGPVNLIRHYLRTRSSRRTLQWSAFGFDVHVQEMFTALASGAALVLIGDDDRYDPDAVVAALTEHRVERLFMTFTPLTALLATLEEMPELPALREIVAGGEAMVMTHGIRDFLKAHPECTLYNEYGPTEASVVTTIHQVDPDDDRPSIGRPIDGVVVRLLDAAMRPVPAGAIGEIHLGGVAVAQGYVGRPEETMSAFVADPAHPGGRLYRTRDLGRWRPDGTLDYLGRVDDQVKIRGHRVEPGETEHVLADLPGVTDAVVVACTDPAGETCLIGYVVLEDDDPAVLTRLMMELTKDLPIYLVPADLIPLEELPLDASGKLDRSRLPEPEWLKE
ncbi:amino acid adenylation domain-containing protein [Kribbella sp. VKM Ac-2527]|uniref:Amino acid adenylation domain-containing protein n=2 Tax=Kribbella caucasensis TaxID=2512215 RepID=A0A4R6K5C2_9ACTN|nr:amino acid adenylation domain-containing protein [Kribbella sp. VKM Ac-2527]